MPKCASSFIYLSSHPEDNGKSFLSATYGFLPSLPLPPLPAPFCEWQTLARLLPSLYQSGQWDQFVASLPDEKLFPMDQLSDQHLLRANLALSSIAHAIFHIAKMTIPVRILMPWTIVSDRLGRPVPCLSSLDFLIYNPESLPEHRGQQITSPLTQVRPAITLTPLRAEFVFVLKAYSIEHAARSLPRLVTRAQNAVLNTDDEQLRESLIDIIDVLENMTRAFTEADSRPLNKFAMDSVDWARSIDISASPTQKGGKGGSGLLFPSIHLLDAFFCRSKYETEMGKLEKNERCWLPQIHRDFFSKVAEISILDYLVSGKKTALLNLFRRALLAFGGESGFLGKHRIRLTGYLEIMFKIGREATGNGIGQSVKWNRRIWRFINDAMKKSMRERVGLNEDWYTASSVKAVSSIAGCDAFRVQIDANGALQYKPGDLLAILPENRDSSVHDVLNLLKMDPDSTISVTDPSWVRLLSCKGFRVTKDQNVNLKMIEFFRLAKLQPLDRQLGSRIAELMNVNDALIMALLKAEEATNVKGALQLLQHVGSLSAEKLATKLDRVFEPLTPRYYSISSHMAAGVEPGVVEIVVGPVQYKEQDLISLHSSQSISATCMAGYSEADVLDISSVDSTEEVNYQDQGSADSIQEQSISQLSSARLSPRNESDCSRKLPSSIDSFCSIAEGSTELLYGTSSSFLRNLPPGSALAVRVVPSLDFRIPADPTVPLIMISQGTGFAPFRPFLKELILQKRRGGLERRRCWLVLGVRSRYEIPFIEDIEAAVCTEKVAELSLAISREDFEVDANVDSARLCFRASKRMHVRDLLSTHECLHKLWHMVQDEAHIFVCGKPDLELMTREVLAAAARKHAPKKRAANGTMAQSVHASHFAESLCANKRLHADCYDSGKAEKVSVTYTRSEVARHRTSGDCWVTFRDGVYDISQYVHVHPGGAKLLLEKGGRDITEDFNTSHGADNYRVASMLHLYKIAQVEQFAHAHEFVRGFMNEWSVPLLEGIQERHGVFELDWNNFEDIDLHGDTEKSVGQYTMHNEAGSLCQKFIDLYEPEMFELLKTFVGEKLSKQLRNTSVIRKGVLNTRSVVCELECIRTEARRKQRRVDGEDEQKKVHRRLKQCAQFLQEYISMGVEVQRSVEQSARCSQQSGIEYVATKMLEDILHSIVSRTKMIYKLW